MANIIAMEETARKPKKRQKLCHNCEGEIDLEVIVCPFCAADLRKETSEQGHFSLYSNPNRMVDAQTSQSLYPSHPAPRQPEASREASQKETPLEEESKNVFIPTVLFTLGAQLVLLGLLILLFSHKGVVVLKWDASWWFVYCLAGCPLFYFGYRALAKL
ncbi:MAG TPA: hypothetical protein VLE95_02585 [Chlamydiales bacterium]|nr:hypothetical protein [Chlamydiales bacterium]